VAGAERPKSIRSIAGAIAELGGRFARDQRVLGFPRANLVSRVARRSLWSVRPIRAAIAMTSITFRSTSSLIVAATALLVASGCSSTGTSNQYRAKVSQNRVNVGNTTQTAGFGTIELEAGGTYDASDRMSAKAGVRVGTSETSELFVEHDPYVRIVEDGKDPSGSGDVVVGFRQRLLEESKNFPATALEFSTSLPVGDDDPLLTSGYTNFYGAFVVDRHFGDLLTSFYYKLGAIGTAVANDLDAEHTIALAGFLPVTAGWTAMLEFAGTHRPEFDTEPIIVNAALLFNLTDALLFDIGVQVGLNDDAPDAVIVAGVTTNVGRIF
jgi:hypothetical protein